MISPSDLARFGLLVATGGEWEGERLLDPAWLRGHGGGNRSGVHGESEHFTALGVVTTEMGDGLLFPRWCSSSR